MEEDLLRDARLTADLLLEGAEVVDGTGGPPFRADVVVAGDQIVAVGVAGRVDAARRIHAEGLTLTPGFVDAHGHSDIAVLSAPDSPSKIHQGVTTEVMGNCGLGVAPFGRSVTPSELRKLMTIVDADPSVEWNWRSVAEYLDVVRIRGTAMNVTLLAGHLPIRASCVGYEDRRATGAELHAMQSRVDEALDDGACGLSTGLMYPPCTYADVDELVALGEVVAEHDAVFAFHMRDYGDQLLGAVEEALLVARRTGCRAQLSHLVAVGRRNWGKVSVALDLVDRAVDDGIDVAVDVYPYLAGSTNLAQVLPEWALAGGTSALLERLADASARQRLVHDLRQSILQDPEDIRIAGGVFDGQDNPVGLSLADLAEAWDESPQEVVLDVLADSNCTASMVAFGRGEDDLRAALRHQRCLIGSDGLGLDPEGPTGAGQPHPRSYGCYPRLLSRYVRDEAVIRIEDVVRRSTSLIAQRFRIPDRGVVAPGYRADLVLFDLASLADRASFEEPHRFPDGVSTVIVGGEVVVDGGEATGARPGEVLEPLIAGGAPP